jgi:hypothetical protein
MAKSANTLNITKNILCEDIRYSLSFFYNNLLNKKYIDI